ncbi:hypothetical protein FF38_00296 [Lucilia cuprina]|uniref:Uncharacterized protein n=1 Tax=Lucilia cuprina TaxID=7375 RepID=A0A0L0BLX0_LUCCU|nr:hypothetical protein FF38_00296 [Lucilia cuprina]
MFAPHFTAIDDMSDKAIFKRALYMDDDNTWPDSRSTIALGYLRGARIGALGRRLYLSYNEFCRSCHDVDEVHMVEDSIFHIMNSVEVVMMWIRRTQLNNSFAMSRPFGNQDSYFWYYDVGVTSHRDAICLGGESSPLGVAVICATKATNTWNIYGETHLSKKTFWILSFLFETASL